MLFRSKLKLTGNVLTLTRPPEIRFSGFHNSQLILASDRFKRNLSLLSQTSLSDSISGKIVTLKVKCKTSGDSVNPLYADESYLLRISSNGILLRASGPKGVLHGFETILQLVDNSNGKVVLPTVRIEDAPRYPWRGLMIDVCRHWIPKDVLLRNIDAMAAMKMNVLHWHLTDYQAFRIESKVFPKLQEMGSSGHFYTQSDVREVIQYAYDRGIRVVPEFDLPGHSTSWFAGYPELASAPGPYVPDTAYGVLYPVMDPTKELVYDFLDLFFGEMASLFPDPYIHIGGDEVNSKQWDNNRDIQAFIKSHDMKGANDLQAYFNMRLDSILIRSEEHTSELQSH